MAEHIDGSRLSEDLRYRFDYLSKFLNFTSDDIYALNNLATIILPLIPVIVDTVYRKLFQFDITKDFFILRNDGFGGRLQIDESLSFDSAQMTYRRDMLSGYLKRLFLQQEWTDEFIQYLSRIARMHSDKQGSALINVDYIHINATLSYIEHLIIDTIWVIDNIDNKTKKDILMALNKVFTIQNDLFILYDMKSSKENTSTHQKTDKCVCS